MSTDPTDMESQDPYVEARGDQFYVRDSEVPLTRIVTLWHRGASPQAICDLCPPLALAAIYGSIAYYLSHDEVIDRLIDAYQQEHQEAPRAEVSVADTPPSPVPHAERDERSEEQSGEAGDEGEFDHFTPRARTVMALAREEGQRFKHNYIGTEHILLGLVREEDGVAARVLQSLGIELRKVRSAVEFIIGRGDRMVLGDVGLTPRAKKVIELAVDEARRMGQSTIGTEHLLLGLVREGEGIAAGVLESLGVNLEKVRVTTIKMVDADASAARETAGAATPTKRAPSRPRVVADAFVKFNQQARRALAYAQAEAQQLNHNYIGTEHLMLALVRDPQSISMCVLARLGVEDETVRETVLAIIDRGDRIVLGDITLTPRAKRVVELAVDEARRWNARYISTEHLLLGAIRLGEGVAAGLLESLNVTYERAAEATKEVLREQEGREE